MTEQSADPEVASSASVFIRFVLPLIVIGCVIVGTVVVVATHRPPPTLSAQELHDIFANQRLSFWHVEEQWRGWPDEKLDGGSAGFWAHTGAPGDSGRWWLADDTVCIEEASGTGCWRAALGPAGRIYWYSPEGDYAGTFTMRHLSDTDH